MDRVNEIHGQEQKERDVVPSESQPLVDSINLQAPIDQDLLNKQSPSVSPSASASPSLSSLPDDEKEKLLVSVDDNKSVLSSSRLITSDEEKKSDRDEYESPNDRDNSSNDDNDSSNDIKEQKEDRSSPSIDTRNVLASIDNNSEQTHKVKPLVQTTSIANKNNKNKNNKLMHLPSKLKGIPIESTVKLDKDDRIFYKEISKKYGKEISKRKLESHFIHRFIVGFRHIKKKKRMQTMCKEIDYYLSCHDKFDIDHIINTKSTPLECDAWKQYIYGEDRCGHPVVYDMIGSSDVKKLSDAFIQNIDPKDEAFGETSYYHVFRFLRRVDNYKYQNSKKYGVTIHKHIQVMDMKGFTSKHLKGTNRKLTQKMIDTMTRMFPEVSYKMYIINAPWPFRMCWSVVKGVMDDITVDKTKILGEDYLPELLKEIDINMIPKEYGGKGKWKIQYGDVPKRYPIDTSYGID